MARARRKQIGVSQQALGAAIGIAFQQIQKYERGSNRISASKLFEIAKTLKVPIDLFFEGLDAFETSEASASQTAAMAFMASSEGGELSSQFGGLTPAKRRAVLNTVKSLAALND